MFRTLKYDPSQAYETNKHQFAASQDSKFI